MQSVTQSKEKIPELFGSNVFNEAAMQQYVSGSAFQTWKNCLANGSTLPLDVANDIADGMKIWALAGRHRGKEGGQAQEA